MDAHVERRDSDRQRSTPDLLTHREARLIVLGVLLPTFMGSLDQTILANALPTIGRDLGDIHNLPWLITAYLLASTAVIPLYGKIADIHGRRFTLRIAILTYMAGSLVCALAPSMPVLIFGRVLHGLGGGGLTSMGMVVLGDLVAPKERGRYYGYFSATYTTAGGAGPLLGGLISDHLHWSFIFWINIPMGLAALLMTQSLLRRLPRYERPHHLDFMGAGLVVVASVSFMLALNLGGVRHPWMSAPVLALLAASLGVGGLFVLRLMTAPEPLIPISIPAQSDCALRACRQCLRLGLDYRTQRSAADLPARGHGTFSHPSGAEPDGVHDSDEHQCGACGAGARPRAPLQATAHDHARDCDRRGHGTRLARGRHHGACVRAAAHPHRGGLRAGAFARRGGAPECRSPSPVRHLDRRHEFHPQPACHDADCRVQRHGACRRAGRRTAAQRSCRPCSPGGIRSGILRRRGKLLHRAHRPCADGGKTVADGRRAWRELERWRTRLTPGCPRSSARNHGLPRA